MEDRKLPAWVKTCFRRHKLEDRDALERPAVPPGDETQLPLCLGERYIKSGLPLSGALTEELECEGRLAGAGPPLAQIEAIRIQTATKDIVETHAAG